jgi:hypothetical protein
MSEIKIRTNRNWRKFKHRYEVPAKVLASQFDWTNEAHAEHGDYSDGFFEYRGCWYHLADFVRAGHDGFPGWDGYAGDSYFSGVLIKLSPDGEEYQIATYVC